MNCSYIIHAHTRALPFGELTIARPIGAITRRGKKKKWRLRWTAPNKRVLRRGRGETRQLITILLVGFRVYASPAEQRHKRHKDDYYYYYYFYFIPAVRAYGEWVGRRACRLIISECAVFIINRESSSLLLSCLWNTHRTGNARGFGVPR